MNDKEFKQHYRKHLAPSPGKKKRTLNEGPTWENRKFGGPLPTMQDYKEAYNKKQINESDYGFWFRSERGGREQAQQAKEFLTQQGIDFEDKSDFAIEFTGGKEHQDEMRNLLRDQGIIKYIIYTNEEGEMMNEGPVEDFENEEFEAHSASLEPISHWDVDDLPQMLQDQPMAGQVVNEAIKTLLDLELDGETINYIVNMLGYEASGNQIVGR